MKAREITELLRRKIDPDLLRVLVALAERQAVQKQEIEEIAKLVDKSIDIITDFTRVAQNLKTAHETILGMRRSDVSSEEMN